jgi:hypothetical protein
MDAMTGALAGSGAITIWQDARAEARDLAGPFDGVAPGGPAPAMG